MNRKRIALALLACMLTMLSISAYAQPQKEFSKFKYQGLDRLYYFYMPKHLSKERPLVFMLHAIGGTYKDYFDVLIQLGEREGFAVCVPFGWPEPDSKEPTGQWNCHYIYQANDTIDDAGYLFELSRYLQKKYKLNPNNLFCTGQSTGGDMCYVLAVDPRNTFAAFAPNAGCLLEDYYRDHPLPRPVPMLILHGTNDPSIPFTGDPTNEKEYGNFISVPLTVNYWIAANRCTKEEISQLPVKSRNVVCHRFTGGVPAWKGGPEAEVRLLKVINGGHGWPDEDMNTYEVIWDFFKTYLR